MQAAFGQAHNWSPPWDHYHMKKTTGASSPKTTWLLFEVAGHRLYSAFHKLFSLRQAPRSVCICPMGPEVNNSHSRQPRWVPHGHKTAPKVGMGQVLASGSSQSFKCVKTGPKQHCTQDIQPKACEVVTGAPQAALVLGIYPLGECQSDLATTHHVLSEPRQVPSHGLAFSGCRLCLHIA